MVFIVFFYKCFPHEILITQEVIIKENFYLFKKTTSVV